MIGKGISLERYFQITIVVGLLALLVGPFFVFHGNEGYSIILYFIVLIGICLFNLFEIHELVGEKLSTHDAPTYRSLAIIEYAIKHAHNELESTLFDYTKRGFLDPNTLTVYLNDTHSRIDFNHYISIKGKHSFTLSIIMNDIVIEKRDVSLYQYINFDKDYPGLTSVVIKRLTEIQALLVEDEEAHQLSLVEKQKRVEQKKSELIKELSKMS